MKPRERLSTWTSPEAERRFRALEDRFWHEHWPDPPVRVDVDTHFGLTRAYSAAGEGEPLVFLHGFGGTSVMWAEYFAAREGRAAFAVDTIGDLGRSEPRVAVGDAAGFARWLDEVLQGLGVEHAHLVGTSYGGFLALNQATRRPDRVRSMTLLDPVGIAPVRLARFLVWGVALGLSSLLPDKLRSVAARRLRMPLVENKDMMRMVRIGQMKHRTRVVRPERLTDDQLRSIGVPVLLLAGAESEVFRATQLLDRAVALIPDVDAEIVADAGHALPVSHTEHVVRRLAAFVGQHDETSAAR